MLDQVRGIKPAWWTMPLAVMLAFPALATGAEENAAWSGKVGAGGVRTSGNTQTQSLNATASAGRRWDNFEVNLSGKALSSSDQNVVTSEKYNASISLNYHMNDRLFLFQDSGFVKERFSGYRYRVVVTIGAGYTLLKNGEHDLSILAGGGIRHSKLEGIAKTENEGIAGGQLQYSWKISPTSTFTQSIASEYGKANTVTRLNSDLSLQIIGNLAAQIGFHVTHTSKVPLPTVKKTDTESTINAVYSF